MLTSRVLGLNFLPRGGGVLALVVRHWRHSLLRHESEFAQAAEIISYADIDSEIQGVLPSFFHVLGEALKLETMGEIDIAWYQHEFENNNLE
jgi:hypothetical protein